MLSESATIAFLVVSSVVGFLYGLFWWYNLSKIKIVSPDDDSVNGDARAPLNGQNQFLTNEIMNAVVTISQRVSDGATTFLVAEYKYMLAILSAFGILLFVLLGICMQHAPKTEYFPNPWVQAAFSLFSFTMGSLTSVASGWIGMRIAVYANSRTAVSATEGAAEGDSSRGFAAAFAIAFRGGITMGFCITCAGLFMLFITIEVCRAYFNGIKCDKPECLFYRPTEQLYEAVAAFGLGGSAIACFGRVGGGIFTKAADVGADLVGKVEKNIPEDDARNPGVIADCIGDNVGDIAGMGSDLFGSFGEASCSALVIAAASPELSQEFTYMAFPLLITAVGVIVCLITSLFAAVSPKVKSAEDIEPTLKNQLIISTVLNTGALIGLVYIALPEHFTLVGEKHTRIGALVCVLAGLWSGLLIGFTTEYFTSNTYRPVQEISEACETGAATNIIYGLALGYLSVLPPILAMAVTIFVSSKYCGLYGYALAALGILSTMAVGLTIDAYGPISDNAGGFAEMAHMGHEIREITDSLDAAGNTTAAIGKGFAISSAAFVGLALYGAFITRANLIKDNKPYVDILDERVMPGLLVGAMLPYLFFAMTMKSVGMAAMEMVNEIRRQFQNPEVAEGRQEPDYNACVMIATNASLRKMIAPGALVMFTPIAVGILFGKLSLAGLLPGAIISGVQMAISSSNTGGAWDNAKKYIEKGGLKDPSKGKGSDYHAAAVIGDTVGDPLKDTSGPALNILIKLMAIISVVFAPVFNSPIGGVIMNAIDKEPSVPQA